MAERPLYTLYKGLKANNYDVPSSYDSFEKTLVEAGNGGANARHTLFNSLKSQGYDVPDTYESFYRTLFTPINKTTSRAIGGDVPMSEADKRRFSAGAANISAQAGQTMQNAGRYNKLKNRQKKQKNDFGRVNIGTHQTPYGGDAENVVKDDFAYNPETGKAGTYVNSDSDDAYNLAEAEQKQAALDQQNQAYQEAVNAGDIPSVFDVRDKTGNYDLQENVGKDGTYVTEEGMQVQYEKKLADAYARKKELEGMIAADNEKNGNPLLSYSASVGAGSGASQDRRMMDVALNQVNAEINSLEAITQTDKNAWYQDMQKAMENTAFTAKTWDFGISDFALMGQLERIKAKMDQKIPLNGMEQTLLKSKVGADAAAALEDEKMGAIYRWTKNAGQSLPFMLDFFLTGGYGGITKGISSGALKFAAKRGMGKVSAAILKNTGIVAGDVIGSYAMAGTEQALKTGADIMQRHLGNLYQDENGNYKFGTFDENGNLLHEGGDSMGKALYKGMTAAMLENYTEKIFGHNYGLKKGALRFMENHGMARSAEFFKNIGQKEWYAGSKKWMEKFGFNGFAEEVMEEEINIPLNALLVGDNKASDLLDPKQQMDIIGGMALSVGSMYALGAGTRPLKGVYNRAQYYRYKNKVDSSDTDAYTAFGSNDAEKWESLRDKIDNAPNEKMGGVLASIIASRDELTKDQIDAAVHYGINLMKMRGYNLAKTEEMNAKEMTGETATPEEQHDEEVETAYSEGHDAEDADKHNIQMEAEDQMTTLAGMLGITEQQLSGMTDEELESLTGQDDKLDQAIYDYQLSTARYQGVVDNANDKVEAAARQASHQTDMLTDKSRGTVRNATVIGINGEEDYGVYIISGKLATHEDGAINIGDSDSMIIYYDPKTQSVEHADARRFVALGDEVPAEEVKAQAIADAKEAAIKAEAGIIDGTVEAGTQFSTTDADGSEHTYEVLADNGDGTAMITIDGNVEQNPYTFEELQTLKDAEDLKRLNAAKAQREMMEEQLKAQEEEQRAQQQKEDEQKNAILEQITNADGNVVLVDVIDADGNTRYPGSQVFLVSNDGAKAKVMEMDAEGNLKPHAVNKEDITEISTMSQDEFKQTLPPSNIEEDRGEIEVEEASNEEYTPITDEEADAIIADMESRAEPAADIPLTPENWESEFGENGTVQTPVGEVKMGENQIAKLFAKGRSKEFGMIKPTLENPDVIIEVPSSSVDGNEERASSYLFVKTFLGKNGKKIYYFKSVTIKKEGLEISVSSHYDRANRVKEDLKKGKLLYRNNGGAQTEQTQPSASVTTSQEGSAGSSESKGTNNSAENNENNETLTLEDGTVVPMLEDGNPDFSQLTAEQTAELYDSQFGDDAEQIISGFVSEAKKALDKATNMSVKGKNFAEQKASKADKDKAVADAQTAYDSAKAISDAYAERQLSKETDTHEGRMNLIQKAKNKYARLKNKEEWKNNPFALWNETVGKVLHRLYDGTSVDVFDHEPQTVEEYVSSNIAPYSLNFEGKENSKGVAAETGLQRKDFAKSRVLAAEGKGKTVDEFVHKLWEDRPKQLENVSDQEIRNALLSLITSDMNAYDMSHVIEDNRIAQAEEELENNKRAAENAAFEEEQRKAAEEETKKQEEEAKKQAEVAATSEETGKLNEEMADANDEYEHLAPSYNFENDENLSEEERENMVLRDGDTFAEYRNRNGVNANGTTTPLGIKVARAYIQQKYGDKLADIDAIFGMPMKDHYDGWLMAEQMMKIVDADMNDFDAALLMKNDNVPLSSKAILGYMDGAAELIKARQDAEKLGLAAFDSAGNPVYKSIIELANWAKEQGLEVDGESVASNYANLYLACKDGFGATTLVPDKGELINMVFYFPGQLIGENGEVNQERLRQMADEFNEGRDALHSAEADIELTDGAQFYNGDTAREFRDFVDKKTEEENKPFGEQIDESELPFSVKEGKGKKQYDRAADVEKNHVSGIEVVDAVVGRKTRKAFDRLAKMMGAKIQWQYSDKLGNGWIQETTDADGNVHRTIFITLDSSITEGAQFIFGHEMTHQIKNLNPAAYNELTQLVLDTYGYDAFDKAVDETMQRYSDAGFSGRARDYYAEEVVADAVGEMIRDLNLAHTLAMKMSHPLLAAIHEILQKIKLAFFGTEYSDVTKNIIRSIEQAYVKTAKGEVTNSETGEDVSFCLRQKPEPKKKGIGYKVFVLKDSKLYPPMVANPDGAATPVGVWLDADAAPIAGESKTGRPQVKQGGKGTQGGSGKLAYRPGWHLGVIPYALQFNRKDAEGNKTLFPKNFVFAEVEYAADVDYQQEAHDAGINHSGKYQHSLAGLKHLPTDGYYMYRTNPNPETDPWVITGAMKVNRILTRAEQAELVKNAGREPQQIQEGDIVTDDVVNSINQEIADALKFSLKVYHGSGADFTEFDFDHMGEGAGSQTFGWGGYVTSSKKIGKSYANIVDANAPHQDVEYVGNNAHEYTDVVAGLFNGGQRDYDDVQEFLQNGYNSDKDNARKKQMLEWFESTKPSDWKSVNDGKRNLYEVDIPDDNGNNYLDFENPMNEEQINTIRDALVKNGIDVSSWEKRGFKLELPFKDVYAAVLPMMMRCEPKEVSKFLSSLGYTGIKYPAGTIMGGAEEGDTNYVIFKPENMQITKHTKFSLKNAKPVRFEKKELEAKLNALEEVRRTRNNDILKQYMDEHQLSSENEVPDDVWMNARKTAYDEYTAEADKVIDQMQELNKKLKALSGNEVRYSLKDTDKTLAGVHNITEEKLLKAIKMGGLANPSVAVIDSSKQKHEGYGDISLILPSDKVAKRTGKNAGTWQGDAWTPTYPQVEKQISNKGSVQVNKDVLSVPKEMQHEVRSGIDRWVLDGNDVNSGLKYLFLHEKGVAPKMVELQHKYSDKVYNDLKSITSGDFDISSIGKADAQKVLDVYIDNVFGGDRAAYEEKQKYRIARYKKHVAEGEKNPFLLVRAKNALEQYDKYGFYFDKVQEFVRKVKRDHRMTGVDTNATLNEVEDYIKTNNLTDEFNTWREGKEKEYGIKEVIFDGFTPSGNRRYVPNTLENVSKLMKKQGRNGATGAAVSFQNFAARQMPSYGTLKDIRSKKGLLTSDREKFDKFRDKWSSVFFELGNKCQPDSTSAFDSYGMERLSEAAMTSDPQAYLKKEYNVDFSDADTKRLKDMVKAIKEEHPAMYFETKFERPVGFDEFSSAVVPTTTKKEVKEALKNAGVSIFEYDEKSDADRSRAFNEAINSSDNIRFSLAGERGAAAADKAEERTFRMDNLSVARKMEEEKKDAKAIKMATGWERGADGKWRYEMPDAKIKDTMNVGGGQIVKRYDDDMLWNGGKLSEVIDAPELFKAYPQLKDVRIETDAVMNDMPSNGEYNSKTNTITIHADELKYMNDILNHEIQHAIQNIEGFAKGGSPRLVRGEVKKRFDEVTKQIKQLRAEGKEDETKALIEKNRGLYNAYQKNDDYNSYKSLAGEVEARNVSARLNMTPEKRRKSLAESTEDVARKDQIFLGVGDVSFSLRDMANGKESGAADMAEDLKSLNTHDEVDDAIKTAIDDMPSGWKMANKKMIHIAQALGENRKAEIAGEEPKFSLKDGSLIKAGTYFSGGGLVEEGLKGIIDPVVAVEYDEKISGVYRNNFGQHIVTADVRDVDPRELVKQIDGEVEYFHASPVCKNYSQAKSNHAEVELDKETAASTAEFINAVKPKVVTIENVKGYKDSEAMKIITDALDANGYTWDADVYNAADFGGYTNRERLIVRAVRDGKLPEKPKKMARKSGWYEAVADIIPTLTEKKNGVAPWMDIRLKADGIDWRNIDKPLYVMGSAYADGKIPHAFADELLPTLRTKSGDVIVMPDGKVYRALGRVLARVSGVSDDYKMPFSESLGHTIIGNGIPTQLTEHVIAPLVQNTLRPTPEDGNTKFSLRYDQFEHDLNQWKKDNGLKKDAQRPAIPTRDPGESAVDFMKKVNEYRRQMALWKTAPTYEGHLLTDGTALGEFNRELQRGSVLKRIAFQDSMLAIRKAQEAIMKEVGVDRLNMAEDAYTAENRSHGKGKNEFEEYNNEFLQPLRKAYHQMKKILGNSYDNVRIYMMAKHGLERDAQMAFKKSLDADYEDVAQRSAAYKAYKGDMNRITNDSDLEFGRVDFTTWRQRDNALRTKYSPSYMDYRYDENGIAYDYSGLSALFGGSDFEEAAHKLVRDIESSHVAEVQDLWNATNAATKKILRDGYKAGMMSKDTYLYVRDMYSHYIPLRGWDGTTADQVWDYVGGGKGAFNQTLKTAHGRTSIADDPIAYIENMAESGILLNNKNWVKQHLMLLAQNHPTSLLTLSKAWYVKGTDANGNEEWIPATPQITSQMNSNQVKAAIDAFEQKMEQMAQTGDATQKRDGLNIAYPQTHSEEREHEVRVMKDGEEYVIYVNGDPQLAQAMNNTRAHRVREVQSGKLDRACAWLGRKMAAAYTSLSPLFIPSNYFRDLTMTLASTAIREDGRYNYLLRKNMATSWNMWGLLKGYKDGSLREKVRNGKATEKEQMFYDFMMNGGETGFVSSFDVEDLKKKFKGELKDMDRWAANPKKVLHTIYDSIEFMNRSIENSNRFAIYMTSIQYGRSIEEAVNNAKDVTLNFNRKGTGENGWQMIRNLYLFINPAVQSLQTLGALAKHHPYKFTAVTSAWMVSGALVPLINEGLMLCANLLAGAFGGGDDDDEYKDIKEKYWQFTKWDRRNNLIMWVPFTKEFVKIPLAQEFRGFYAVGDMIASKMLGGDTANESWGEYAEDLMGQVVDMLPLDPTGYDGNIAVSLMPNAVRPMFELAFNVDFTGKPLFKDSEYNKYDPNFTKAYAGTPDWLVRVSSMVNSIGNDYPDVQQNSIDAFGDPRYNLNNPAVVDHVLSSYLGGAYTMGSQVMGVLTKALNDPKEIKMADIPLVSKFVSNPEDRPVAKKQGDKFWTMKENHDRVANTLSKLKKQAKVDGDYSLLEQLYGSEEYKQYKLDDAKVKKYEEDKKKEKAEETGEEYKPHQRTADDVYKEHSSAKDELEDLKMKQIYAKLNGFKSSYDLLLKLAPKQSDDYYQKHKVAIDAVNAVELDKKDISDLKKDFLKDGVVNYDAEKMQKIRGLRKNVLDVLEKANKEVIAEQQKSARK